MNTMARASPATHWQSEFPPVVDTQVLFSPSPRYSEERGPDNDVALNGIDV